MNNIKELNKLKEELPNTITANESNQYMRLTASISTLKGVKEFIDEKFDEAIEQAEIENSELINKEKEIGDAIIDLLKTMKKEIDTGIEGNDLLVEKNGMEDENDCTKK